MEYRKRCWIKMSKSKKGHDVNERGVTEGAKMYEEGQAYYVDSSLAEAFVLHMEVAKECDEPKKKKPGKDSKDAGGAPENKGR